MAPKNGKPEKAKPPEAKLEVGGLGMYPLTAMGVYGVEAGKVDRLVGRKGDSAVEGYKRSKKATVNLDSGTVDVDLTEKVYDGIADAFYRGKLPEVLVCTMPPKGLDEFVEALVDFFDKLRALGFLLNGTTQLETFVPCFVVATNGIFFSNLLKLLEHRLVAMPGLEPATLEAILNRFTRGVFDVIELNELSSLYGQGSVLQSKLPQRCRLGGGNFEAQMTTQAIMSQHGFIASLETQSDNPAERLELENALFRINTSIVPLLESQSKYSEKSASALRKALHTAFVAIGEKRKVFSVAEALDSPFGMQHIESSGHFLSGDVAILKALKQLAVHHQCKLKDAQIDKAIDSLVGIKAKFDAAAMAV